MKIYNYLNFAEIVSQQRKLAVKTSRLDTDTKCSACRFYIAPLKALCIFTLDIGHHTSGWWKNPDYETCWHLSISFQDFESGDTGPQDHKTSKKILKAFFESHTRLLWCEPPYSKKGKVCDVWHYRLFVDTQTLIPFLPRGEVYTREFTEAGWKSYSEIQAGIEAKVVQNAND